MTDQPVCFHTDLSQNTVTKHAQENTTFDRMGSALDPAMQVAALMFLPRQQLKPEDGAQTALVSFIKAFSATAKVST